jgi:hypothetical protein
MKRLGKCFWRLILLAVVCAAAAMACWIWVAPGYVESRIIDGLRERGLIDATVRVRAVTANRLQLTDFQTEGASAGAIAVTFDGDGVHDVDIVGAAYTIAIDGNEVDLGPLAKLTGDGGGSLPFDRLRLDAATLVIEWRQRQWRLPFSATIESTPLGAANVDATVYLPGMPLSLHGSFDPQTGVADITGEVADVLLRYNGGRISARYDKQATALNHVVFGLPLSADRLQGTCVFEAGTTATSVTFLGQLHGEAVRIGMAHIGTVDLSVERDGDGASINLAAGPLVVDSETIRAEAQQVTLTGAPTRLRLAFDDAAVTLSRQGVKLDGISVDMPIVFRAAAPEPGTFAIDSVTLREDLLPGLTGTATVVDGLAAIDFAWPLLDQATMRGLASIDLSTGSPRGSVSATIERFELTDAKQLGRTFAAARPFEITGSFAVDARAWIDGDRIEPTLMVDAKNATVRGAQWDVTAEGVDANLTIDGIDPLTTPGAQRIHIDRLRMGRMSLDDGLIVMRVEGPNALLIERTDWQLGDTGRFWAHGFRIDPANPVFDVEIFIEDLPLIRWLVMISEKKIEGEGFLYGRLPIRYRPGTSQVVSFGRGYLYSRPGTGWVRVGDRSIVETLLAQAGSPLEQAGLGEQVRNQVIGALLDFEYETLRFEFLPQPAGDLTLRVTTSGKGRTGARQEIGSLTINFNGFDIVLRTAIMMRRGSDDAINAALDRFFEPIE